MTAQISHDPYARHSIMRRTVYNAGACHWCGRGRPGNKLFEYGIERDDRPGRIAWARGRFCSISCWRAYGGG